tara:strand:- start:98583 stop:99407 length:825 start_codon:yes stop_codon:yes gene_type:complete
LSNNGTVGTKLPWVKLALYGLESMDWEDKFRRLRKDSDGVNPAFPIVEEVTTQSASEPLSEPKLPETQAEKSVKSEKETVLQGLKELAVQKENESGAGIKFPGGEVKLAESTETEESISIEASESPKKLKVLFVYNYSSDALAMPEENRNQAPSEQLLSRMIKAMKMDESEYETLVIEEDKRDLILNKLAETIVEIVVPMGAIATNLVLGKQERISKVHGKFFNKDLVYKNDQVRSFQVVPVFNPEMILINPNMKRSTWMDLQKIMEKLGIPLE